MEFASSPPPHIQPPMAQVPRPMAEASMPDFPILRVSMSCDIPGCSDCFEDLACSLPVDDQRLDQATIEHGLDRLDFLSSRGDADRARAALELRRVQGHQAGIEWIV